MALRREKPHRAASRATFTGQVSECCWKHKNFPGTEQTYAYYYDPWGQFKTAFHYEGERRTDRFTENGIAYDLNGNITALTRTNDTQPEAKLTYRYSGNLLIDVKDKQTIVNRFSYDANGNVLSASRKGWKYDYNYLNLTERITDERLNVVAEYRYLSDGTKIGVKDKAGYGYDYLGSLIYRRTPTGLELESTDFAGGRIVRTATGYAIRYFVRDYLGSVRAVVDEQGRRIEANDYMPFGSRWNDPTRLTTDNRYLFNGKEWQPTGGVKVLDYGARHYDPELGRWFNPDPAMQFLNPYTFCANDPVNRIDPNGLWTETVDGFTTTDPDEISDFLNGKGDFGYLLDPTQKPEVTTETDNTLTNPNGDGGGSPSGKTIMINGTIYSGNNSYADVSYFLTLLRYYQTQKGKPVYMTEKMLAYLLTKGKIIDAKNRGDYWEANIDFYGSDWDLALSFGKAEIKYSIINDQINIYYFYDNYNFDWKVWGRRSKTAEILTRIGSFIPGNSFDIIFIPNPYE